jgi:hypothetical protein
MMMLELDDPYGEMWSIPPSSSISSDALKENPNLHGSLQLDLMNYHQITTIYSRIMLDDELWRSPEEMRNKLCFSFSSEKVTAVIIEPSSRFLVFPMHPL